MTNKLMMAAAGSGGKDLPEGVEFPKGVGFYTRHNGGNGQANKRFTHSGFYYVQSREMHGNVIPGQVGMHTKLSPPSGLNYQYTMFTVGESNNELAWTSSNFIDGDSALSNSVPYPTNCWFHAATAVDGSTQQAWVDKEDRQLDMYYPTHTYAYQYNARWDVFHQLNFCGTGSSGNYSPGSGSRLAHWYLAGGVHYNISSSSVLDKMVTDDIKPTEPDDYKSIHSGNYWYMPLKSSDDLFDEGYPEAGSYTQESGSTTITPTNDYSRFYTPDVGVDAFTGHAVCFDGDQGDLTYVYGPQVGMQGNTDTQVFTLSMMLRHIGDSSSKFYPWGTQSNNAGKWWCWLKFDTTNKNITVRLGDNTSNHTGCIQFETTTASIYDGCYHSLQIVGDTRDNSKNKIYVDNVAQTLNYNQGATNDYIESNDYMQMQIGCDRPYNSNLERFEGMIGEVWYDNRYTDIATDNPFWDSALGRPKACRQVISETGVQPLVALPLRASGHGTNLSSGDSIEGKNLGTEGPFHTSIRPMVGSRAPTNYIQRSINFGSSSGSSGYHLKRTGGLGGRAGNSKIITYVITFRAEAIADDQRFFEIGGYSALYWQASNKSIYNNFAGLDAQIRPYSQEQTTTNTWTTILFSCDLTDTNKRNARVMHVYGQKGAQDRNTAVTNTYNTYTSTNHDYGSSTDCKIGRDFKGDIANFYFTDEYIDFGEEEGKNTFKFLDCFGYPLDLGNDGSKPTGTPPLIYLRGDVLGSSHINLGVGGNFDTAANVLPGYDVNANKSLN